MYILNHTFDYLLLPVIYGGSLLLTLKYQVFIKGKKRENHARTVDVAVFRIILLLSNSWQIAVRTH